LTGLGTGVGLDSRDRADDLIDSIKGFRILGDIRRHLVMTYANDYEFAGSSGREQRYTLTTNKAGARFVNAAKTLFKSNNEDVYKENNAEFYSASTSSQ